MNLISTMILSNKEHKQSATAQTVFVMEKKGIKGAIRLVGDKRLSTVAGAWVYYFLMAVVPLAFLMVTAFSVFGVDLAKDVVSRLPEEFRGTGEIIASTAERAGKGTTIFFVFTVILSCTTLLKQMSKDGDYMYGVRAKHKRGFLRRVWAFFGLCSLFAVFLGAAFLFAFGSMLFEKINLAGKRGIFIILSAFLLLIIFGYAVIVLLNKFISPIKLKFKDVCLGALCSLFIIVLGTIAFTVYLRYFSSYNAFYGSLAAIIIFLLWAYILMTALALGVIINTRIYARNKERLKSLT